MGKGKNPPGREGGAERRVGITLSPSPFTSIPFLLH